MRIAIVIPSDAFRASAGATIRYQRMIDAADGALTMVRLDDLTAEFDGYLFSKAYHPTVPALAAHLAASAKRVVLDVFDDYFTHRSDNRLAPYAVWFDRMARASHAITVSTPALAERLSVLTDRPITVVPDPAPAVTAAGLAARLRSRSRPRPGALKLAWFGIAGNPYFAAGLADLAASAPHLYAPGTRHHLTILTNVERASDDALAALRRLPLRYAFARWSPEEEARLLDESDAVLLPVNDHPFTTAKSLNRAVTALCAGAQVLSLGAPIYDALGDFIYREFAELCADADAGCLKLREDRVGALIEAFHEVASAERAADRILALFQTIVPERRPPVVALLGRTPPLTAPAAAGLLTAGTVFTTPVRKTDVTLHPRAIRLSDRAKTALGWRAGLAARFCPLTPNVLNVRGKLSDPVSDPLHASLRRERDRPIVEGLLRALFPHHAIVVADKGTGP